MAKKTKKSALKAEKNSKSTLTAHKMQKLLKENKIRGCSVSLFRLTISNSPLLQNAILRHHGIRPCAVHIERMQKKLTLKPTGTVHSNSNISWFPTSSTIQQNSSAALSSLLDYQQQNNVTGRTTGRKNITLNSNEVAMKRQRAKSMFDEPAKQRGAGNNKTMEDLHLEFSEKYQSMNRGLKPSADRQLREPLPAVVPESRKIFEELKAILRAKNAKK